MNDPYFDIIVSEPAIPVQVGNVRDEVCVDTGNGHGSTNTRIRRFTNTRKNVGAAITYADSSTLGASFTINQDGVYGITYTDLRTGGATNFGISVNSSALTTNVQSLTYATGLRHMTTTAESGFRSAVSVQLTLSAGDVVRPHTDNNADGTDGTVMFTITKVSN